MSVVAVGVKAQSYEPNTQWPYIYADFADGKLYFDGDKVGSAKLNIHLWGNTLHFVNTEGRICANTDRGVTRAEIGSDVYLFVDGKWLQLVHHRGTNLLLKYVRGNFDSLNSGTGAYGASLNSSGKTNLSSLDLGGMDQPELGRMLERRYDGRTIPLVTEYVYMLNDKVVSATKKDVTAFMPDALQADFKAYLKTAKTKWKSEESLSDLLDWLAGQAAL